jgi:hypothetical protein
VTNHRVQILREIARLYPELIDPLNGPASLRGDGESLNLMPSTYTPTVKEYERLVKLMHSRGYQEAIDGVKLQTYWWHLIEFFHRAERVIRHEPVTHKRGKKLVQLRNHDGTIATKPRLDYRRHKDANQAKAERAIQWIAEHWALSTEPMLPKPVIEKTKDPLLTKAA